MESLAQGSEVVDVTFYIKISDFRGLEIPYVGELQLTALSHTFAGLWFFGAVVRALVSNKCGPGLIPRLSLLIGIADVFKTTGPEPGSCSRHHRKQVIYI